ncbi:MAG: UPF0489 family protein [Candidatus Saganbacteria bacterium]|nr:UPF0489 family protein [Candidatus Saganbacteria bacterium]
MSGRVLLTGPALTRYVNNNHGLLTLSKLSGIKAAKELLQHFRQSEKGLSCKYYENIKWIGYKKLSFTGQRVSPIVIGSLDDLSFYTVNATPEGEKRAFPMQYLNEYLLIPTRSGKLVFVSDDHTHAAFAWAMAKESGIFGENAALIHVDNHEDNDASCIEYTNLDGSRLSLEQIAQRTWEHLEICNFIHFGQQIEAIERWALFYHIHPYFTGKGTEEKKYYSDSENVHTAMKVDLINFSLERYQEIIDKARAEAKPVILNFDIDFFCPHYLPNPKYNLEADLLKIIEIAKQADFITIATSPSYFLVPNQAQETRHILQRVLGAL